MDKIFLSVLNMSLIGAFVIAAICLVRLPLKKAPKVISYCLWAVAGFRLVFPLSIESIYSLMPIKPQPIPTDIAMQPIPRIDSGISFLNNAVSSVLPAATPTASVNPLQIWTAIGAYVWLIGIAVMLIYSIISIIQLKRGLSEAVYLQENIYECTDLKTPLVIGLFRPKIYIPTELAGDELNYILLHEQTHIRRHDHIVKIFAYFVLCLHWFNPLAWVAFLLMGADMEMSCDERVMKELGDDIKSDYSMSLVRIAVGKRILNGSPLAFGEGGMKERIKRVLNFKKPSRVIIVVAVALVAVLSAGFAMNRIDRVSTPEPLNEMKMVYEENPAFFLKDMKLIWNDTIYHTTSMDNTGPGALIGYANDEFSIWSIYELNGYRHDYLLAVESEHAWRVMSSNPPEQPFRQYILENATEKQRMERMLSVTLNNDGTANLATPPISSYALVDPFYYTFTDDELLIHKENGEIISRFEIIDDNIVVFRSATVPLFADAGARYLAVSALAIPPTDFEPRVWVDYFNKDMQWTTTYDLMLDEFPGVMFTWTWEKVRAADRNGEKTLFDGMPIWNVFFADINGDGFPELCATVSFGSGLIDTRVIVYDYANDKLYDLSDRGYYDYSLSLEYGRLAVTQTEFYGGNVKAKGSLAIINGELVVFGIDRTLMDNAERMGPFTPKASEPTGYQVNESGQTYGSAREATSIETLPDLMYVGTSGVYTEGGEIETFENYIYTKDVLASLPKTEKEARSIFDNIPNYPVFRNDGKTIVEGGGYGYSASLLPDIVRKEFLSPIYPINENGQTYGPTILSDDPHIPDLILAQGIDGTIGYIYNGAGDHGPLPAPNNPEEAVEYMKKMEEMKRTGEWYQWKIPLYAADGVTVIGEFGTGG